MKTFIITMPATPVPTLVQSVGLRMGYLLSKKLTFMGAIATMVMLLGKRNRPKNINDAVNQLLGLKELLREQEKELLQQFIQAQKLFNKTKNKAPQYIWLFKDFEHSLWHLYDVVIEDTLNTLERPELSCLKPLLCDTFCAAPIHRANSEVDDERGFPMSYMLCPAVVDDVLYNPILFTDFMSASDMESYKQYRKEQGLGGGGPDIMPEPLLSFPNLNQLNAEELRILHSTLQPAVGEWSKTIDPWLVAVDNGEMTKASGLANGLYAACSRMQEAIDNAPLVKHAKQISKFENVVQLCAGTMLLTDIWHCYQFCQTMTTETWNALQDQLAKRPDLKDRRMAFFFLHHIATVPNEMEQPGGKKYLEL